MAELTADLFISLDGFAAGVDVGPFFGYAGAELGDWVRDNLGRPQLLVMGRVTYAVLSEISSSASDEDGAGMNELPKVVFSNTLTEPLAWNNTRLLSGDLGEQMRALKRQSSDPLRSIGSITLVRSLIELGLVDRLRLMIFPLILGDAGREQIYTGYPRAGLDLVNTKVLDSRLVMLEYRPESAATG